MSYHWTRAGVGSSDAVVSCFDGDRGHTPPHLLNEGALIFLFVTNLIFPNL